MLRRCLMPKSLPSGYAPFPGSKNIAFRVLAKDKLGLLIDTREDFGPSSTGKTTVIATSAGNRPIGASGLVVGLNCYTKTKVDAGKLAEHFKSVGGKRELTGAVCSLVDKHYLECVMDCSNRMGLSKQGSSEMVASSSGPVAFGKSNLSFGLNCYFKQGGKVNLDALATAGDAEAQHTNIANPQLSRDGKKMSVTLNLQMPADVAGERKNVSFAKTNSSGLRFPQPEGKDLIAHVVAFVPRGEPVQAKKGTKGTLDANATYAVSAKGSEVTFEVDLTEGTEQVTNAGHAVLANIRQQIPDSNVTVNLRVNQRSGENGAKGDTSSDDDDEDDGGSKKRSASPAKKRAKKETSATKKTSDSDLPAFSKIKQSAEKYLRKFDGDSGAVKLKDVLGHVAKDLKLQAREDELKPFVRQAVMSINDDAE